MYDDYTIRLRYLGRYFWEKENIWIPCGQCPVGQLKQEAVRLFVGRESKSSYDSEDFDPLMISGIFNAEFKCTNCGEITVGVGHYAVDPTFNANGVPTGWGNMLLIKCLLPSIPLLSFPRKCPPAIRDRLDQTSSVIWSSPDLAASKLRVAIDDLLTIQGVNKTSVKNGRRTRLKTHDRIILYSKINPDIARTLEAVKWIGNEGTHETGLTIGDVFDGLDLFGYALHKLYGDDSRIVNKMASKIISKRGITNRKK